MKCERCGEKNPAEIHTCSPPEQEPVAYLCENAVGHKYFRWKKPPSTYKPIALYTAHASPQRIWQGLTDEEQQRMAKRIEELEARLSQPEPAQCDGGQCGIGGYCKQCPKTQPEQKLVVKLKELLEVQGRDGTWNYDPYFHGMYNGMEVMLAVLENREPVFRGAPKKWLSKKEWQGLTDEEIREFEIWLDDEEEKHGWNPPADIVKHIEAKLKEKNNA